MVDSITAVHQDSFWSFRGKIPLVDDWFLMSSPFPVLLIFTSYLFFVLRCGPKFMTDRPAYSLRNVLLMYNAFQVIFSCYIAYYGILGIIDHGLLEYGCRFDIESEHYRYVSGHYLYFIAKLTELLDTVFFVLRKKWNQITFLHVYHHSIMFLSSWITLKYEPTYSIVFLGTLNTCVHIIMYTYYGLSAFPKLEKYLWWKKYITSLQLIQFLVILIHLTWNWHVTTCPTSYIMITIAWANGILFVYLFLDFYIKSYIKNNNAKQAEKDTNKSR